MGAAREKVRVAHILTELSKINAAFETGALSFSKVRAMTRIATLDNEDYLLMIETSLVNLLMLCRHHHRELHQGKFIIEKAASDIKLLTAKGKLIRQTIFPQFPKQDKMASIIYLKKLSPKIEKHTAVTKWQGERMDYDAAIGGLNRKPSPIAII